MDKEQEQLEFLNFIGILKESMKIILSHPKILSKISIFFLLPLTFIALANNEISKLLPTYSKWKLYWGIEAVYFIFIFAMIFSLLSISAVVYTAACIYTGKDISFNQVARAIPSVWKRLVITLLSNFCILFAYAFLIFLCILLLTHGRISTQQSETTRPWITITTTIMIIILSLGVIYITIFWQLANVISVMEDHCGFKAMKKSRQLIKGKLGCGIAIMLVLGLCYLPVLLLFRSDVNADGIGIRIVCIMFSLVLNPLVTLYSLVVQTVFYCVCKSYHHETIDKSVLANHLEELRGDFVPLLNYVVEIV